ncbi:MAG: tryptophan synthase subunit alpha [Bacteroidetes bacterium]|nr:MAG: tryptophan synthase subunit alpha [Bacteroidota bacterium]
MKRIRDLFERKNQDILNIYFTAGYPNLADTGRIIGSLAASGVDIIEVGMPYSDPLADGPTIQASGTRALQNGMTLPVLFDQLAAVRPTTDVPLILMGYFNQVMQYGEARFFEKCAETGVDGLILPDLPLYEYETQYRAMVEGNDLGISFLITPQTPEDRIRKVDALTRGFIYMVSNASITGAKSGISAAQKAYFGRVGAMGLKNPRLIGFGISDHDTFSTACQYANGAIIGSAFIRALSDMEDFETGIPQFVDGIRNAPVSA